MKNLRSMLLAGLAILVLSLPEGRSQIVQTPSPLWTELDIKWIRIRDIAVIGADIFVASYEDVFLSKDRGASWMAVHSGLPLIRSFGRFQSRNNINFLAAVGTNLFVGIQDQGVFRSADSDTSWTAANSGLPEKTAVWQLAASGTDLFAATAIGIFRSTNNGASWTAVGAGLPLGTFKGGAVFTKYITALGADGNDLFVSIKDTGTFKSADHGASWTGAGAGLPEKAEVTCLTAIGTSLYASTRDHGAFLSTDHGASWTAIRSGLPEKAWVKCLVKIGTELLAATDDGIFLSTDNGRSWTAFNSVFPGITLTCFAVSGTDLFAGTWGNGVFRSSDHGASWAPVNSGLSGDISKHFRSLAANRTNVFVDTDGGLITSTDNGTSWVRVRSQGASSIATDGTSLYVGGEGVFLSTDNGRNWKAVGSGFPRYLLIYSLLLDGKNILAVVQDSGIYLLAEGAEKWMPVNSGLSGKSRRYIPSLVMCGADLFAGTEDGVYRSTDHGKTWGPANSGLAAARSKHVTCLAVIGTSLFAGTEGGGVFVSTDGGTSWSSVSSGVVDPYVRSFAVSGTDLFVGTDNGGVFLSRDTGKLWTTVGSGIPENPLHTVDTLIVSGPYLLAGTRGGGLWRAALSDLFFIKGEKTARLQPMIPLARAYRGQRTGVSSRLKMAQ